MQELTHAQRMELMKFVCSFAWSDLKVTPEELELVVKMASTDEFSDADREQISRWLDVPPAADPNMVPRAHRKLFLDAARAVVAADGRVVPAEADSLRFFEQLLG